MKKFEIGQKVVVIQDNEIKKGTIKDLYVDLNLAIVRFDDSNIEKIPFDKLGVAPVEEKPEEPKQSEPVEKSEITITPEAFRELTSTIIAEESKKSGPLVIMVGTILIAKIHTVLFEADND